jgi:hypothetical protein
VTVSRPASSPDTPTATGLLQRLAVDRGDKIAVDLADQHHADDLQRLRIGDTQAVAKLGFLADAAHHRVHLGAAAMDQDDAHADTAQQKHVLRQGTVELGVDRRAAELHDHRFAGEAADVGQRLNKDARGMSRGHEVTLFSLM